MKRWTTQDARELYAIERWGEGFFGISEQGSVEVYPTRDAPLAVNLDALVQDIQERGLALPLLIRFPQILDSRITELNQVFNNAIEEFGYPGRYQGVYPIKVNQQRHVVHEIVRFGKTLGFGLEAGSKPELLATIALTDYPDALIICNGYKDEEYIETALLASKLQKTVILVVEKFSELETIAEVADRLKIRPRIGIRMRLSSRGAGHWEESGGDRSKFGLGASSLLQAMELLRKQDLLDCFELLHFHLGSQIADIRSIKNGVKEAVRFYTEIAKLGAELKYLDVGGGLGIDYDGSRTRFSSSINYSWQEYANDIVFSVGEACEQAGLPAPTLVSESGRAITAHHSILVMDVLGVAEYGREAVGPPPEEDDHRVVREMYDNLQSLTIKNYREVWHDAVTLKDESLQLFSLGYLSLGERARAEDLFWAISRRLLTLSQDLKYVPDELSGLQKMLADTYFCNVSFFQSVPDAWAVDQLFPVMPIHRLDEEPDRQGILADITCDSDGKLDRFIDLRDVKNVLELHSPNGRQYCLAVFLVGAYQEILGDLHNLFGDTNAVHVFLDSAGAVQVDHVVEGDTVGEVLRFVEFSTEELKQKLRRSIERCVQKGLLSLPESRHLSRTYEQGLNGYTYLESDLPST